MDDKGALTVLGPFETTDVRVFDANLREVAAGTHAVSTELTPGIYRVVAQVPGSRQEKLVVVEAGKSANVSDFVLDWDSITPHGRSRSRHEYQTEPAARMSLQTHLNLGGDGRLLLYVRTKGAPAAGLPQCRLLDGAGKECAAFPKVGEHDLAAGWIGVSLTLPAGTYQIEHLVPGLGGRAQAIFVDSGWQTQAFVPWGEGFEFASAVLHMFPRREGFRPDNFWKFTRTEAALDGLASGRVILQPGDIDGFLHGKFHDPMLGLIGAYALMLQEEVDYEKLGVVSANLLRLIPHSPDARLLKLVVETRGAIPPVKPAGGWPVFTEPPLFAVGVERLFDLAAHVPELCPVDSWLGRISLSLSTGSVWTRWDPSLDATAALAKLKNEINARIRDSQRYLDGLVEAVSQTVSGATLGVLKTAVIAPVIRQVMKQAAPPLVQWLEATKLLDIPAINARTAASLAIKLAPELRLPQSVVAAALTKLLNEALPSTLKPAPPARIASPLVLSGTVHTAATSVAAGKTVGGRKVVVSQLPGTNKVVVRLVAKKKAIARRSAGKNAPARASKGAISRHMTKLAASRKAKKAAKKGVKKGVKKSAKKGVKMAGGKSARKMAMKTGRRRTSAKRRAPMKRRRR